MMDIINFKTKSGKTITKPDHKQIKKHTSVYGIAVRKNAILLVQPTWANRWEFPGGGVSKEEDITQTLRREFVEETGYTVVDLHMNPIYIEYDYFYRDDTDEFTHSCQKFFRVTLSSNNKAEKIHREEIRKSRWVNISTFEDLSMLDSHRKAINEYLKKSE